jgi:hypothetical protein
MGIYHSRAAIEMGKIAPSRDIGAARARQAENRYSDRQGAADRAEMSKEISELRALSDARDEFHLAVIVQNLKTLTLQILRPPTTKQLTSLVGALIPDR